MGAPRPAGGARSRPRAGERPGGPVPSLLGLQAPALRCQRAAQVCRRSAGAPCCPCSACLQPCCRVPTARSFLPLPPCRTTCTAVEWSTWMVRPRPLVVTPYGAPACRSCCAAAGGNPAALRPDRPSLSPPNTLPRPAVKSPNILLTAGGEPALAMAPCCGLTWLAALCPGAAHPPPPSRRTQLPLAPAPFFFRHCKAGGRGVLPAEAEHLHVGRPACGHLCLVSWSRLGWRRRDALSCAARRAMPP